MKLKEFKKFINDIPERYDDLNIVSDISEGAGLLIEQYFIYKNVIALLPKIKRPTWDDGRYIKIKEIKNDKH